MELSSNWRESLLITATGFFAYSATPLGTYIATRTAFMRPEVQE